MEGTAEGCEMTRESSLYIVDVFVPNPGEPESALELTILRVMDSDTLPQVYVHTYIRPEPHIANRIHWNVAANFGLDRAQIMGSDYPTLHELIKADYLRDKFVVCWCSSLEPLQTIVANAHHCYSLINMWQEVFEGDEDAGQISELSQMLDYMGLPPHDSSNCHYTKAMKRCRAQIAIWLYLFACRRQELRPARGFNACSKTVFWPIDNINDPWHDPHAKELTDIPPQAICDYFSERLPEYVPWQRVRLYGDDWRFQRERIFEVKLGEQDAMLDFIFYKLFELPKRLMILTYYALCQERTNYARLIALHQGQFNTMSTSIKEDFTAFVIAHLTDFLLTQQKHDLIRALVKQALQSDYDQLSVKIDFDEIYQTYEQRKRDKERAKGSYYNHIYREDEDQTFVRERLESNHNIIWYREIRMRDRVMLRHFTICGNDNERDECIDHINAKIEELIGLAQNPMAPCWLNPKLKTWIECITGFAWSELDHVPRPSDAPSLTAARNTIRDIIAQSSRPYYNSYISNLKQVIAAINETQEGERNVLVFSFQGISYKFDVDKSSNGTGLLAKIRQLF